MILAPVSAHDPSRLVTPVHTHCPHRAHRAGLRSCRSAPRLGRDRTEPDASAASPHADPDGERRHRTGMAERRDARSGRRPHGGCFRAGPRPSPMASRPSERRCARRRDQCATQLRWREGTEGLVLQAVSEAGGRSGSEPQPDHAAARQRRRWRRRHTIGTALQLELPVRHGAGRRRPLCRERGCDRRVSLRDGDAAHHDAWSADRSAAGRPAQPSLDEEPDRERGRHEALLRRGLQQQRR